jgi:long-chain fatty acid transport protein
MPSKLLNMNSHSALFRSAAAISVCVLTSAHATNGTSPLGYGAASQGMGGVGIALPTDAVAAANNPAGMGLIGQRWDADLGLLMLDRGVRIGGSEIDANRRKVFPIPEGGLTYRFGNDLTLGVSLFNNGVNTSYGQPIGPPTNTNAGASLMEIIVAPTVAYQASPDNWFGASIDVAYQRLKLQGLENVGLTDQGTGTAHGAAVSVGWLGQLNSQISLGASFRTKTDMTRQEKYKNLLADQGKLDIPANIGVGVAVRPTNAWTFSADILKTFYSKVHAYGNNFFTTEPLGETRQFTRLAANIKSLALKPSGLATRGEPKLCRRVKRTSTISVQRLLASTSPWDILSVIKPQN